MAISPRHCVGHTGRKIKIDGEVNGSRIEEESMNLPQRNPERPYSNLHDLQMGQRSTISFLVSNQRSLVERYKGKLVTS